MPMQPSPISETVGPSRPSRREGRGRLMPVFEDMRESESGCTTNSTGGMSLPLAPIPLPAFRADPVWRNDHRNYAPPLDRTNPSALRSAQRLSDRTAAEKNQR